MPEAIGAGGAVYIGVFKRATPGRLKVGTLPFCRLRCLGAGLQQRLVPQIAFTEHATAVHKFRRQIGRCLKNLPHAHLLGFWEDGKRIGPPVDYRNSIGNRRQSSRHGMAGMVGK